MVFSWNSSIVYCLDREGIFMSRSRGYFHVSIKRVFSTGSDLNLTFIWSSVLWNGLVFSLIAFPSESTYETVCFGWVSIRNFLLTSKDIGKGILRTKFF